jgi:protein SCO1/2
MARLITSFLCFFALFGCSDERKTGAPVGGDFVLQSASGPVDTKALRGKVLLIYFGYTNCPDICPASMAAGAQALNALSAKERARTMMIMISVDPERDSPAKLKDYAAFFHPDMIGVTGTAAEIEVVARSFGAGYIRQPPDANGRYVADHSANTYLIDPEGQLVASLPLGTATADVVAAIRKYLP